MDYNHGARLMIPSMKRSRWSTSSHQGSMIWTFNICAFCIMLYKPIWHTIIYRYANRTGLYAVELLNEPLAPGVALDVLQKYYKAGYDTVRKYSDVYVIMSNRLGIRNLTELVKFASGFVGSVIDVHYYNVFSEIFEHMSVQQNINYVKKYHAADIRSLTVPNGTLIFIGTHYYFSIFLLYLLYSIFIITINGHLMMQGNGWMNLMWVMHQKMIIRDLGKHSLKSMEGRHLGGYIGL